MTSDPVADTADFPAPVLSSEAPLPRPAAEQVHLDLAALSDRGNVRSNNEDIYLVVRADRILQTLLTNLPDGDVPERSNEAGYGMLVADGVGGMAAGEVASRMAVRTLVNLVLDIPDWILKIDETAGGEVLERINQRYQQVDAALKTEAAANPDLEGMGTTMTLAFSLGRDLFLGHIGDSRAYLHRGGRLHQLTRDHTYAQELANVGVIRPDEVAKHRFRNVLTRALGGVTSEVEADVERLRLSDGDQILLCTDGLTDMVTDPEIGAVLRDSSSSSDACRALVELALKNGGKDNVTVAVARYHFVRCPL